MDIKPVLNLNRHPRDCDDFSLIDAENIVLSADQSVLVTEPSIEYNKTITNSIEEYYISVLNNSNTSNKYSIFDSKGKALYKILACIECSNELVIFVAFDLDSLESVTVNDKDKLKELNNRAVIFRYNIDIDKCIPSYNKEGGIVIANINTTIKGTFTYNVENALIIAIAEYYTDEDNIPLRTINLGKFDSSDYSDLDVTDSLLSVAPEIYLPSIYDHSYIKGSTYKGWYYFFIRFKINKVDYTQWFVFGYPIYIDNIEEVNIIKYGFNQCIYAKDSYDGLSSINERRAFPSYEPVGYVAGCSDYISNTSEIATITAKFNITFNNIARIKQLYGDEFIYQVGFICSSKSYTKPYRTYDIINNESNNNEFIINPKNLIEASAIEFIADNYNYYNVKNITNYKNRLYIANYKENNINDKSIQEAVDNIDIRCAIWEEDNEDDFTYNIGLIRFNTDVYNEGNEFDGIYSGELANTDKQSLQYDCNKDGDILLSTYLNVSGDTKITVENVTYDARQVWINKVKPSANVSSIAINIPSPKGGGRTDISGNIHIAYGNNSIYIDTSKFFALTPIPYINTKKTFETRIKSCTLIPGEIYNFYIHFIDKYGQATNGYKIENKKHYKYNGESRTWFYFNGSIISFPADQNISSNGILDTSNMILHETVDYNGTLGTPSQLLVLVKPVFERYFSAFSKIEYDNIKWYQVTDSPVIDTAVGQCFGYFRNTNDDLLFKVPDYYTTTTNKKYLRLNVHKVSVPKGYVGFYISYEKFEPRQLITGLLTNSDFRVNHYKTNDIDSGKGDKGNEPLTKSDILFTPLNFRATNKMRFYSSDLDISDKLKFDYSILKLREVNFAPDKYKRYWQQAPFFAYPKDYNKPITNLVSLSTTEKYEAKPIYYYPIPKYKYAVADSAQDNRMGLGTCIEMDNDYGLFGAIDISGNYNTKVDGLPLLYIATLINNSRDIYMNKEKVLIRCGNYFYRDYVSGYVTINRGLNGKFTYNNTIIYDAHGVAFNEANGTVNGINNNFPFYPIDTNIFYKDGYVNQRYDNNRYSNKTASFKSSYDAYTPFMNYVQFGIYKDTMYESKSFKKEPRPIVYPIYVAGGDYRNGTLEHQNAFTVGCMVEPKDSIDLFENRQDSSDAFNPKTYTNFRDDLLSIENYDKTLRRSNVIKDESRINGWRTFPLEGYKNIAENKGKITNLYGVGTIFLVHTEHSLFMFDTDNTMKTENKTVQLYQPDTFEVDYKEVLTSDLGYGGLQDNKSWIADQFGYIYYNRDSNRFFIFDAGQLGNPDEEIIEFLNKYRPITCIFLNDKERHRLLVKMGYLERGKENYVILSFNYDTKKFISRHTYDFDIGFNTKVDTFMLYNDGIKDRFYQFLKTSESYSIFKNQYLGISEEDGNKYIPVWARNAEVTRVLGDTQVYVDGGPNPYFVPAKLKIVVNSNYNLVKFIEYITYKLYKINAVKDGDYVSSPVERRIQPFSGVSLRVYNDQIDTGVLNILVNSEDAKNVFGNYDKPYWDLGNWNFSYLRNTKDSIIDDIVSRLYGNWFVFEFVINNDDNKVEFESLMVNLSKDKRV